MTGHGNGGDARPVRHGSGANVPRRPLTIAVAQPRSHPGDPESAVAEHVSWIAEAAATGASVVLFPELSLSGYEPDLIDLHGLRFDPGNRVWTPILRECRKWSVHALVGAPVSAPDVEDGYRGTGLPGIGVVHIDPDGKAVVVYRKQHLDLAEIGIFAAGTAPATLTIQGWRLAVSVRRDATVLDHLASAVESRAHAYLVGALYLIGAEDRIERQMREVTARGMWAVLAQYSGGTGGGPACGGSGIWGPDGLARVRLDDQPGVGTAELTVTG